MAVGDAVASPTPYYVVDSCLLNSFVLSHSSLTHASPIFQIRYERKLRFSRVYKYIDLNLLVDLDRDARFEAIEIIG